MIKKVHVTNHAAMRFNQRVEKNYGAKDIQNYILTHPGFAHEVSSGSFELGNSIFVVKPNLTAEHRMTLITVLKKD